MSAHDFPPGAWRCARCRCGAHSVEAKLPCKVDPETALDAEFGEKKPAEIDWLTLNRGSAAS